MVTSSLLIQKHPSFEKSFTNSLKTKPETFLNLNSSLVLLVMTPCLNSIQTAFILRWLVELHYLWILFVAKTRFGFSQLTVLNLSQSSHSIFFTQDFVSNQVRLLVHFCCSLCVDTPDSN